jgi:hypothetical protein
VESERHLKFWLWPNLLSLDAPLVAVLWQLLFVRCFHAGVNLLAAAVLALAVWLIYVADRVLDAWTHAADLPRHEFYRRHWRSVLPVWLGALAAAGWAVYTRLPSPLMTRGLAVAVCVAVYFAIVHLTRVRWPKEAAVAVVFALGASISAWDRLHGAADVATVVLFSCLCWINCAAIEQWERRESGWPIGAAALGVAAIALLILSPHRPVLGAAESASAFAFVALDLGSRRLSRDALRVLADVALLSPLLFLPVAGTLA